MRFKMPRFSTIRAVASAVSKAQMLAVAAARQTRERAKAIASARVAESEEHKTYRVTWTEIIKRHSAMAAKAEAERAARANAMLARVEAEAAAAFAEDKNILDKAALPKADEISTPDDSRSST